MRARRTLLVCLTACSAIAVVLGVSWFSIRPTRRGAIIAALPDSVVKEALVPEVTRIEPKTETARKIVAAAKTQIGDNYDASYYTISYPGGDVPTGSGACTDVVIRAFRGADIDLQKLIHDDMKANFRLYPNQWKLGHTDTNIDHRRVPNHIVFFKRFGQTLPIGTTGADLKTWEPGDIVEWKLAGGRWHTGVISDGISSRGLPMVVHNGWKCVEQDALDGWIIIAHFRFPRHQG
ncbi:hypothetical protein IAD21_05235 [Abditibacteriota bacterium]|nr:hypothetical protein IAD21_05235 [Abditibacteriota bacterium]